MNTKQFLNRILNKQKLVAYKYPNKSCHRNIRLFVLICTLLLTSLQVVQAQELLVGLGENVQVPELPRVKTKAVSAYAAILELPFVDDFSKPTQFVPDPLLWDNSQKVFINNTFAMNPPTIGVATFDPFDKTGRIYAHAGSNVFAADTLTSQAINLDYSSADSVYLSFFYQPQGYGDMPESGDSLCLQFYDPKSKIWTGVWSAYVQMRDSSIVENNWLSNHSTSKTSLNLGLEFVRTQILIDNAKYLLSGFKFRFVNYASIVVNTNVPGRSTATDHWHLDYVYLDKNRRADDLSLPDIAITVPQASFSKRYEAIPATHLGSNEAQSDLFDDPMVMNISYTNLGMGVRSVSRNFRIHPIYGLGSTVSYNGGAENINNDETINFTYNIPRYEFTTQDDVAAFEVSSYLTTDSEQTPFRRALRYNDTTHFEQWFRDYYAYDDGTAENGYGLFGAGTSNGQLAVKFYNFKTDSLRGVYLYFNRAVNEANYQMFKIAVWEEDSNGKPGQLLHAESGARPVFKDSLNQFVAYRFSKPVPISNSTNFFVGWIQSTEDFLNIGFDRNRDRHDNTYYNIGPGWEQSTFTGSIMMRPIFCRTAANFPDEYEQLNLSNGSKNTDDSYMAYPNPARGGELYLDENDRTPLEANLVELYNMKGGLVKVYSKVNSKIDINSVDPGIYLLRVWKDGKVRAVKRIVVAK